MHELVTCEGGRDTPLTLIGSCTGSLASSLRDTSNVSSGTAATAVKPRTALLSKAELTTGGARLIGVAASAVSRAVLHLARTAEPGGTTFLGSSRMDGFRERVVDCAGGAPE